MSYAFDCFLGHCYGHLTMPSRHAPQMNLNHHHYFSLQDACKLQTFLRDLLANPSVSLSDFRETGRWRQWTRWYQLLVGQWPRTSCWSGHSSLSESTQSRCGQSSLGNLLKKCRSFWKTQSSSYTHGQAPPLLGQRNLTWISKMKTLGFRFFLQTSFNLLKIPWSSCLSLLYYCEAN